MVLRRAFGKEGKRNRGRIKLRPPNTIGGEKGMQHIVVTPFQSQWKEQYETEARAVRAILGEELIAIHHIGSTAVEGLAAKPIIDILAVVRNLENAEAYDSRFEELGYECMGEYGIPGRRYFRKGGEERTHQIHMFPFWRECHGRSCQKPY